MGVAVGRAGLGVAVAVAASAAAAAGSSSAGVATSLLAACSVSSAAPSSPVRRLLPRSPALQPQFRSPAGFARGIDSATTGAVAGAVATRSARWGQPLGRAKMYQSTMAIATMAISGTEPPRRRAGCCLAHKTPPDMRSWWRRDRSLSLPGVGPPSYHALSDRAMKSGIMRQNDDIRPATEERSTPCTNQLDCSTAAAWAICG